MKKFAGMMIAIVSAGSLIAWTSMRSRSAISMIHVLPKKVGTAPGRIRPGDALTAFDSSAEDHVVAFSAGCFWGTEQAFRKMPGIIATAVGYTGGTSTFPTYERAHATGHVETVLVEFNPKVTPFSSLLKTFWDLHMSTSQVTESSHRPAIWTYSESELNQAKASRDKITEETHKNLAVRILPAQPFYLAEAFHQQYDEKVGRELCPAR